ncbi:hypothetical protein AAD018_014610 [Aestuariibius insulae]|uniref:hypothetical protein n=1 Tax=Aestuariibius insulae TaxID=2058287 RepID=UPI00345EA4D0
MSTYLSKEIREGLEAAQRKSLKQSARLRLMAGSKAYPVIRLWETGFALDLEDAPSLRGFVDLFDGSRHVAQCLVIASQDEGRERHFEFKRRSRVEDEMPLDFERAENAPVALLT